MDAKDYLRLQEQLDALQRESDRAQGAADSLLQKLRDEHGVKSVEDAQKLLLELEREHERLQEQLEKEWESFQKKWAKEMEGL